MLDLLDEAGFEDLETFQTLFSDPDAMSEPDSIRPGLGESGFVAICATICD